MGLMSGVSYDNVNMKLHRMIKKAHDMGKSDNIEPFITLSFLALPMIPQIRITPRGVFDTKASRYIKY